MTVQDVWNWLDGFAPFSSQEDFDNAGLLVGSPRAEITHVLFAVDATPAVVQDAVSWGAQLLVTHHPLMFGGIHQIRYDLPEGETLRALINAGLHLIAVHTNLDAAEGGTGDSLAAAIGLTDVRASSESAYLRTGAFPAPKTASSLLSTLRERLGGPIRYYGDPNRTIRRVAVGAGADGGEFALAANAGAQAFVVGEIKHHELLAAVAMGLSVYEVGHHFSEQPGIAALCQRFQSAAMDGHWPVQARLTNIPPFDCTIA